MVDVFAQLQGDLLVVIGRGLRRVISPVPGQIVTKAVANLHLRIVHPNKPLLGELNRGKILGGNFPHARVVPDIAGIHQAHAFYIL